MKKLAVIMSLYKNDRLKYFKMSVDSILEQTYNKFDLFIQCDGAVEEECRNYILSLDDDRVHIRERRDNKGLAKSLNELLTEEVLSQNYEYIARMDADDISLPQRFAKQVAFLDANNEIDCLGTWAIEINEQGEEYFRKEMPVNHKECFKFFEKRDCMIHPTVMFRRRYFDNAGLYPEDTYFGEDTIMWAQGFASGIKFSNLPENLLKFRLDNNFFERRRGIKHAKSILKLRNRVNTMLNYGFNAKMYAYLYAFAKLMPTPVLNLIYKTYR